MRILIDTDLEQMKVEDGGTSRELSLYTPEAFSELSRQWVRVGWAQRYSYAFTWLGRPVIQLPEDLLRIQEVIWTLKPDLIVETGVAHGGALIFYASLCQLAGRGRVVGVDIEIRPHNRTAIATHPLGDRIQLIEGSSVDPRVVQQVQAIARGAKCVLVLLDSNHTKAHVRAELDAYAPMVTSGSYIVATDGIMLDLHDVPGGKPDWAWDHATAAAREFVDAHPEFVLETPRRVFDESGIRETVTYWPGGWIKRR
jgi:cephalosporin hydroxylase